MMMEELKLEPLEIQDPLGIRVRTDLCDSLAPSLSDQAPTMAGANSGSGGGGGTGGVATEPPLPNPAAAVASSSSKHYRWVTTHNLDRTFDAVLGGWRKRVTSIPIFHET